MLYVFLILLVIGIISFYQGTKLIQKAGAVTDEEERLALIKAGTRTKRWGKLWITIFCIIAAVIVLFILYVEYGG